MPSTAQIAKTLFVMVSEEEDCEPGGDKPVLLENGKGTGVMVRHREKSHN